MKLKNLILFVVLLAFALWGGLSGMGTSSKRPVKAEQASARTPKRGTSGPSLEFAGEETPAAESDFEFDPDGTRAARSLPALPAEDSGEAAATFQFELADFLLHGERSFEELPGLWRRAPHLRGPLVRAVGEANDPRGLRFLAGVLGEDPAVDEVVLSELGRLAPLAGVELARDAAGPLRWVLKSASDVTAVQAAVYALGRLGDEESLPLLLALLEEASGGVRMRAAQALEEITGLSYGDDAERWIAWYENEEAWYDEHVDQLLTQLESAEEEQVFDAVRGLARLRLYRDETASQMLFLLGSDSPGLRRLACQGLAQLGSRVAVAPLVECLTDADETVVQSAWIALRCLTGLDLPAEHEAWRAATERRYS